MGKYGPEKTPYLDTFDAVKNCKTYYFFADIEEIKQGYFCLSVES